MSDADDLDAGVREPDGERSSDGSGTEDCRGVVHAFDGSTTRFTTFRSEYTSSASIPASRQPVPESFDAAEAHVRLGAVRPGVDDDDSGLHALGEEHRPVHARRVDRRSEPVRRVVDELDRIVEARHAVEDRHRPEELRPRDRRSGADAFDDRRPDVPARPLEAEPAGEHLCPVLPRAGNAREDALHRLATDHRLRIERLRSGNEPFAEVLVDIVLDDDPAR